ncbi:MAG: GNAT family N-acetyltransferase [Solirubrobacteraceae bacterium]
MAALILSDGKRLDVTPLRPADKAALQEGLAHLSSDSAYRRFLMPITHLSDSQLTYLTTLDHDHHEALGVTDPMTGEGVGVARYVQTALRPATAEIAITVTDRWQHKGVGKTLLNQLAVTARTHGISRFSGLILAGNTPMLKLMSALGPTISSQAENGTVELVVDLNADVPRP